MGCKKEFWWWEAVVQARRLALLSIVIIAEPAGAVVQGLTALLANVAFFLLHNYITPYESHACNECETASKVCNSMVLCAIVYLSSPDIESETFQMVLQVLLKIYNHISNHLEFNHVFVLDYNSGLDNIPALGFHQAWDGSLHSETRDTGFKSG